MALRSRFIRTCWIWTASAEIKGTESSSSQRSMTWCERRSKLINSKLSRTNVLMFRLRATAGGFPHEAAGVANDFGGAVGLFGDLL